MKDWRIVAARTLLRIRSVSPIRGFSPPSIVVVGDKLNLTLEVLFNGISAKDFSVASETRLVVRIPESQIGKELKDLRVYSSTSLTKEDSELSLEVVRPIATVQGMDRLVQSWLLLFLTSPGSDIFSPKSGAGARSIVGRTGSRGGKGLSADLTLAVERTKAELLRLQTAAANVPLNERLLSSNLETLSFSEETTALSARVLLKNMIGDRAEVSIR